MEAGFTHSTNHNDFDQRPDHEMKVFPTVTSGSVTLEARLPREGDVNVRIFNALGRQILLERIGTTAKWIRTRLNLSGNDEGLYVIQLVQDEKPIAIRKVLLRQ
jgi:hypothetical protein